MDCMCAARVGLLFVRDSEVIVHIWGGLESPYRLLLNPLSWEKNRFGGFCDLDCVSLESQVEILTPRISEGD